jgi:hypothetical protein
MDEVVQWDKGTWRMKPGYDVFPRLEKSLFIEAEKHT